MLDTIIQLFRSTSVASPSKAEKFRHIPAATLNGYAVKAAADPFRPRKGSDEDPSSSLYQRYALLEPPYSFADCWMDYEQSDVLTTCIDTIIRNCERPHDFDFIGDDVKEKDTDEAQAQYKQLRDFFRRVNEKHSFLSLRKKVRLDREVTGNAFVEVVRGLTNAAERLYYLPSTYVRASELGSDEIPVGVKIPRNGRLVEVSVLRTFRRFGRVSSVAGNRIQWYKELGDPRILDAETGEYVTDRQKRFLCEDRRILDPQAHEYVKDANGNFALHTIAYPIEKRATEIWWFRDNFGGNVYGIPRWISAFLDVRARYVARWLNQDLLNRGGVPKGVVLFQNGAISAETQKHIRQTLKEWGDPSKFNQWITLNIEPDAFSVDLNSGASKGGSVKPEFINLDRTEDYMFKEYLKHCEEVIRKVYRLPALLVGSSEDYTYATAYASQEAAESQIFEPLRNEFDEKVTTELIQGEFGIYLWKLKTGRAKIGDQETFYKAVGMWSKAGLSWNQMVQLGNEMLGTNFSTRQGEIWDMPFEVLKSQMSTGQYRIENNTLVPVATSSGS